MPFCAGQLDLAGEQAEVRLAVLHFDQRRVVLPAQAEVQSQVVGGAPVILEVEAIDRLALAPGAGAEAAAQIGGQAQHEIGFADQLARSGFMALAAVNRPLKLM